MTPSVLIVAGEPSGDLHAGALVRALKMSGIDMDLWGLGGDRLRAEGARLLYDVRQTAVMGFVEVLRHLGLFRRIWRDVMDEVERCPPTIALLVDYPGFNLRLAPELKRRGVRVVYFICPQVWAWHRSRIRRMVRCVDRMISIFPFEPAVFEGTGLRIDYVGHPFLDEILEPAKPPADGPLLLLPGSRPMEIRRMLPVLAEAARRLRAERPGLQAIVAAADEEGAALCRRILGSDAGIVEVVAGRTRHLLGLARAAWITSGTATLEAALAGCPQVIAYRAHPLSYLLGRLLIRVPFIGMVNLVAGRRLCPELIQGRATPGHLVRELRPLLGDTAERRNMLDGYREVRRRLGPPGAARRAAGIVREELAAAAR